VAESQLSLKAFIFSLCVCIEELESVIQMMTIRDSSDKLKKIALRKKMIPLFFYGIQRTSSPWQVPSAQQSFICLEREGKCCLSNSFTEKMYFAISITAYTVLPFLDF